MRLVVISVFYVMCYGSSLIDGALDKPLKEPAQLCYKTESNKVCKGNDCKRAPPQPCYHGKCSLLGECECMPCWKGHNCNISSNRHPPVFVQIYYEQYIIPDESTDYPFVYVRATDRDKTICEGSRAPDVSACPCAEVTYSFADGEVSPFVINNRTGGISVAVGAKLTPSSKHTLTVFAKNRGDLTQQDKAKIVVIVSDDYLQEKSGQRSVKLRKLQATSSSLGPNETLLITFRPTTCDTDVETLSIGDRVDCLLTIEIPETVTVDDMQVEIFTEDENTTLSVMCEPIVTVGGELELSNTVHPEISYYDNQYAPFLIDGTTYNLGTVSNLNTSFTSNASTVSLMFSITVKETTPMDAAERYWITAGVEYNQNSQLWIGQIGFRIQEQTKYYEETVSSLVGPPIIYKDEVNVFDLDLQVFKPNANLTVTATVPATLMSYLHICTMRLCNTGSGYCLDATKDLATYTVEESSNNTYESTYSFGTIVNGGPANSTVDSRISMDIITFLRNDDAVTAGSRHDLIVDVQDGTKKHTSQVGMNAFAARSYITPGKQIQVNNSLYDANTVPDNILVPGESAKFRVSIIIPPSTSVAPMSVTLPRPTAANVFQICAVLINYIGKDISCLEQRRTEIEDSVVYTDSGFSATLNLGGVANTGSSDDGIDNVIGVDFIIKPTAIAGDQMYTLKGDTAPHVGTPAHTGLDLTTITATTSADYPSGPVDNANPPSNEVSLIYPTNCNIPPGGFAILSVKPAFQPDTQYKYDLGALVLSPYMTMLYMEVTGVGSHVACGLFVDPVANYSVVAGGETNDMALMDLGLVYNYARSGTPITDDDTITVLVYVQMKETAVDQSEGHTVSVALFTAEDSKIWAAYGNLTADVSAAQEPLLPTNNSLDLAPSYSTEVSYSEVIIVRHSLEVAENSSSKYVLNYTVTDAWLQITNINVSSKGGQLLCSRLGDVVPTHSTDLYTVVDLGYVCNVPLDATTTAGNSTLLIEVTLRISNDTSAEIGSLAMLGVQLHVSNSQRTTIQQDANRILFRLELPKSFMNLCCLDTRFMHPGKTGHCNITMTILDNNLNFNLEIETPFNDTAVMTISNVLVSATGFNIELEAAAEAVMISKENTTQNHKAIVDFGTITNTGAHTEEAGDLVPGDNDVIITFDLQMADHVDNVNGSSHRLEAGVEVGNAVVIWAAYYTVHVLRDGTEMPHLNVSFSQNSTAASLNLGDKVWYHVDLAHNETSTAEALNVKGHIYLPPFMYIERTIPDYLLSSVQPAVDVVVDERGGYDFEISKIFFTDHIVFDIEATIKTDYKYRYIKNWKGTTVIDVISSTTHHNGSIFSVGHYFSQPMNYVLFDFTVPYPFIPDSSPPPTCASPQAMGVADSLEDCRLSASFTTDVNAAASHARLNGPSVHHKLLRSQKSGRFHDSAPKLPKMTLPVVFLRSELAWKSPSKAGPFKYDRWLKVDLGKKIALTGVQTQGGSSALADGDLGEFEVLYSLDDILYKAATPANNKPFNHQKDSPADHDTTVTHELFKYVEARYVILNLTAYDYNTAGRWYNAVRFEVLGCSLESVTEPCPSTEGTTPAEAYERGFLVDTDSNILFVCDTITHGRSGLRRELQSSVYVFLWKKPDMQCFMMDYVEKQWVGLDSRLRSIIGFQPSTGRLYGLMLNTPIVTYAASDPPYGGTGRWFVIHQEDYTAAASMAGFIKSVSVPFVSKAGFNYSEPDYALSAYTFNEWKATMSGLYKGTEKVLNWHECCQAECEADGGEEGCI